MPPTTTSRQFSLPRSPMMIVLLLMMISGALAQDSKPIQQTLMYRALGYEPSKAAAVVAAVVYFTLGAATTFLIVKFKSWWGLCLPIGAFGSGVGFLFRFAVPSNPDSKGILIGMQIFIVCMPALFLAFNYIVYGRLLLHTLGRRHTVLKPTIIATVFVSSDILTFLIQSAGGAMSINSTSSLGPNIFKVGIVLQAVSYFIFIFLIVYTHVHVKREGIATGRERWWIVFWTMYFSSTFITIRSIYRLIEQFEGKTSTLFTTEAYFYVLDVLALVLAIGIYVPWWPARFMFTDTIVEKEAYDMTRQSSV